MNDYVILLFSDHKWYYARKDQIDGFVKNHKWDKNINYKSVTILYDTENKSVIDLENN